jgi:hypothetical protein
MTQTTIQPGRVVAPTFWRAAITGLVLLFLCVPPAWAAMICHCPPEAGALPVCHQTLKSAKLSDNKPPNHISGKKASHCQPTPSSSVNSPVRKSAQPALTCCEATPQRELEDAELLPATPVGAEEGQPHPTTYQQHVSQAPLFIPKPPREPQRPLYLALSCWLI